MQHGSCPDCGASLDGEPIWQAHLRECGGDVALADQHAAMHGATRDHGRFARMITVHDPAGSRTNPDGRGVDPYHQCPDCDARWPAWLGIAGAGRQAIAGNPLTHDEMEMFRMFDREGWTHEQRRQHIVELVKRGDA